MYRILGPPQLSTMLSTIEPLDSPYENPIDTHGETVENSMNHKSELLNIQQEKGFF